MLWKIIAGTFLTISLSGCFNQSQEPRQSSLFDFSEKEFDFGLVKQSGGIISHDFVLTYQGDEELKIVGVPTSCACTTAKADKEILKKGESAVIAVSFDPNLHEEPHGRFFKTISILTEPALTEQPELKIWAAVDLDLGPEYYKLKENHIN